MTMPPRAAALLLVLLSLVHRAICAAAAREDVPRSERATIELGLQVADHFCGRARDAGAFAE